MSTTEKHEPRCRMRIRDLSNGRTIAEKFSDAPEEVAKYLCAVWALRYRRGLDEWEFQAWDSRRLRAGGDGWVPARDVPGLVKALETILKRMRPSG